MKNRTNIIYRIKKLILIPIIFGLSIGLYAQGGPPPPPGGSGGQGGTQQEKVGGAAHVGGGLIILLALGLLYTSKRIYDQRKEEKIV